MNTVDRLTELGFVKIECVNTARCIREESKILIKKSKDKSGNVKKKLVLTSSLVESAKLLPGDRLDLYNMGSTFALKCSPVGCITVRSVGKTSNQLCIMSQPVILELAARGITKEEFDAWVEDDVIFFK